MKYSIILLFLFTFAATSCKKGQSLRKSSLKDIVFQGKFLGKGCWPVIQIIEPSLSSIGLDPEKTIWRQRLASGNDTLYHNAVGAGPIPDTFMNKNIFYFTVSAIDSNIIHNMDCNAPTYSFVIKKISFTNTKLNDSVQ